MVESDCRGASGETQDSLLMIMEQYILPLLPIPDLLRFRQVSHSMNSIATRRLQIVGRSGATVFLHMYARDSYANEMSLDKRVQAYVSTMEARSATAVYHLPFPNHVIQIEHISENIWDDLLSKLSPLLTSVGIIRKNPGFVESTRLAKLLDSAPLLRKLALISRRREMCFSEFDACMHLPPSLPQLLSLKIDVTEKFAWKNAFQTQCLPGLDSLSAIVMRAPALRRLQVKTVDAFTKIPLLLPYLSEDVELGLISHVRSNEELEGLNALANWSGQLVKLHLGIGATVSLTSFYSTVEALHKLLMNQSQNLKELKLIHGQMESNILQLGLQENFLPSFKIPPMENLRELIIRGRALSQPIVLDPCFSNQFQRLHTLEFPIRRNCNFFDTLPLHGLHTLILTAEFKTKRIKGRNWGEIFPNLKDVKLVYDSRNFGYQGLERILRDCSNSVKRLELEYTGRYWERGTSRRNEDGWYSLTGGAAKIPLEQLLEKTILLPGPIERDQVSGDGESCDESEIMQSTSTGESRKLSLANLTKLKMLILRDAPTDVLSAVVYMTRCTTERMPSVHITIYTRRSNWVPNFEWTSYHKEIKIITEKYFNPKSSGGEIF